MRWIQSAAIALALAGAFVPIDTALVEMWFSTGIYPPIQAIVTPLANVVPFALFDVLTVGAAILLVTALVRAVRRARRERRVAPIAATLYGVAAGAAAVYLVFLLFWGLNYRRLPMGDRLLMDRPPPSSAAVVTLGLEAARQLNTLHAEAHRAGWEGEPRHDASLLSGFASVQQRLTDAPIAVPGRLKQTLYGPYFRWTGVDGMVNPFALEVLANPDLLPFERPFVAAHEWAHLAGFADEAEANFVGWLACVRAGVPAQYSAWIYLYWQITGEVDTVGRGTLRDALADGPRQDLDAIVERIRRGQLPMLRRASWAVYDQYLRANRVEEGIRSYGLVINLILRARFEDGWVPVRR